MSLQTRIESLVIRIAQEFNAVNTKTGALANLTTADKSNLVAAINELKTHGGQWHRRCQHHAHEHLFVEQDRLPPGCAQDRDPGWSGCGLRHAGRDPAVPAEQHLGARCAACRRQRTACASMPRKRSPSSSSSRPAPTSVPSPSRRSATPTPTLSRSSKRRSSNVALRSHRGPRRPYRRSRSEPRSMPPTRRLRGRG